MDIRHLVTRIGQWLGVFILVVATLPVLAIGAWMLRALLVVAAATALFSGCILYCVYPRFRHWASHVGRRTHEASP